MNCTNSISEEQSKSFYQIYKEIILYLAVLGDVLAITGIIKNHLKLFPIEAICFSLTCFIQIIASANRLFNSIFDLNETFCYIHVFRENIFLIIAFSIMIVSYNRVYIMKTSLYDKKQLKISRLKGFARYKKSLAIVGLLIFLSNLFGSLIFLDQRIFQVYSFNNSVCQIKLSYYYNYSQRIFMIAANTITTINYLVIIPYFIYYYNRNKSNLTNNKQITKLIVLTVKLGIFCLFDLISWTLYAIIRLMGIKNEIYMLLDTNSDSFFHFGLEVSNSFYTLESFVLILMNRIIFNGILAFFSDIFSFIFKKCNFHRKSQNSVPGTTTQRSLI